MSGGRASRQKGDRVERALVLLHQSLGVHSERVPLSGAQRYQDNGSDLDVYALGRNAPPLVCESKARGTGGGFKTIEAWLSDADALFIKRDRQDPLVVLPWRTWERLLRQLNPLAAEAAE